MAEGGRLDVQTVELAEFARSVVTCARDVDAVVSEVRPLDDDLESVFRYLVGSPGGRA
jgi:hypothetical protein